MVKPYYLDNVALSKSHDNDATRHFAMTNVAAKRDPGRKEMVRLRYHHRKLQRKHILLCSGPYLLNRCHSKFKF